MMIGVTLKRALVETGDVVVPVDTAFTEPDEESLKLECERGLRLVCSCSELSGTYEIDNMQAVFDKIRAVQQLSEH